MRLGLLLAAVVVSAASASAATKPRIHPECVRASDHARTLFAPASDGAKLAAAIMGKGSTGVVLAHEADDNLCDWMPFARELARAGYRVIVFDFENAGQSVFGKPTGPWWPVDVAGAATALRRDGAKHVVLMGSSIGGWASLIAAASLKPEPSGVVGLSTAANWASLSATHAIASRPVPLLLIASKDDASVTPDQGTLFAAAATRDKESLLVPGGDHGIDLLAGRQGKRVRSAVFAFLRRHSA